jgi:hypothetical protein
MKLTRRAFGVAAIAHVAILVCYAIQFRPSECMVFAITRTLSQSSSSGYFSAPLCRCISCPPQSPCLVGNFDENDGCIRSLGQVTETTEMLWASFAAVKLNDLVLHGVHSRNERRPNKHNPARNRFFAFHASFLARRKGRSPSRHLVPGPRLVLDGNKVEQIRYRRVVRSIPPCTTELRSTHRVWWATGHRLVPTSEVSAIS